MNYISTVGELLVTTVYIFPISPLDELATVKEIMLLATIFGQARNRRAKAINVLVMVVIGKAKIHKRETVSSPDPTLVHIHPTRLILPTRDPRMTMRI